LKARPLGGKTDDDYNFKPTFYDDRNRSGINKADGKKARTKDAYGAPTY
jgi:hypothetical protein